MPSLGELRTCHKKVENPLYIRWIILTTQTQIFMKNYYFAILVFSMIILAACAAKKMVDPAIGSWEYVVTGTPDGDVKGTMYLAKEGDSYTGNLTGQAGTMKLDNITIEDGKLQSEFSFQGYTLDLKGTFEGDSFSGNVSLDEYTQFPITATKKEGS